MSISAIWLVELLRFNKPGKTPLNIGHARFKTKTFLVSMLHADYG